MYILYESGLQMLADSPSHYREEPRTTRFISRIPVTWHESIGLQSELGEYLIMARRHNTNWYIAAMTGSEKQSIQVDLTFLEKGTSYKATIFKDGMNAGRYAEDFKITEQNLRKGDTLSLDMVRGGGWAAILTSRP
jgi:alpha-glucosidase